MAATGGGGSLAGASVLLGVSGGVAAYKAAVLARALRRQGAVVQAVLTSAAAAFVGPAQLAALTGRPASTDTVTDVHRILHVQLAREATVAVVAPATANVLAKMAAGIADDLLTSTLLCLRCPLVVAPAMHAEMWEHPATRRNVAVLRERGVVVVGPDDGELAGGDVGPGRLVDPEVLLEVLRDVHGDVHDLHGGSPAGSLAGRRVVVTAGGTREPLDPVRYLGNRSSGKMGYAIATEALRRGAAVDLVTTASLPDPAGATVHRVETAREMHAAVLAAAPDADVVVKAAAVADFRPADVAAHKLKKGDGPPAVVLEPNPDILADLGRRGLHAVLVGFAAETERELEHGFDKLRRKGADLLVVNRVDAPDAGFAADTNRVVVLRRDGSRRDVPLRPKAEVAGVVLDEVEAVLAARGSAEGTRADPASAGRPA